jgi:hypothetical protein
MNSAAGTQPASTKPARTVNDGSVLPKLQVHMTVLPAQMYSKQLSQQRTKTEPYLFMHFHEHTNTDVPRAVRPRDTTGTNTQCSYPATAQ